MTERAAAGPQCFGFSLFPTLCTLRKSFVSGGSHNNNKNNIDQCRMKNSKNGNGDKNDERTLYPARACVCDRRLCGNFRFSLFFLSVLFSLFFYSFHTKKQHHQTHTGLRCCWRRVPLGHFLHGRTSLFASFRVCVLFLCVLACVCVCVGVQVQHIQQVLESEFCFHFRVLLQQK